MLHSGQFWAQEASPIAMTWIGLLWTAAVWYLGFSAVVVAHRSAVGMQSFPSLLITINEAQRVRVGSAAECNERVINQFIHPAVLDTCQFVMGMTAFSERSVWNTMSVITQDRRMEVYFYFG